MRIIEIPDGLTYQEKLVFLNNKNHKNHKNHNDCSVCKNIDNIVAETEYFYIKRIDNLKIISKKHIRFQDLSKEQIFDLYEIIKLGKIVNKQKITSLKILYENDHFVCDIF